MLFLLEVAPGRLFGLDAQTFIQVGIQLFNAALLAFVMSKLLYNPVRTFMLNRTMGIREQLQQAEENMVKANEMVAQYEAKLREIDAERDELLSAARKVAAEKSKEIIAEAKVEADAIKERAAMNVKIEQDRVKDEMRQAIIDVSSSIAEKFIAHSMDQNTHDKLFNETIAELEEFVWQN